MLSEVVTVEPRGRYRIRLQLQDGVEGEVDLEPLLSIQRCSGRCVVRPYFGRVRMNPNQDTIYAAEQARECRRLILTA
jgi:hypothetical protein